jgi:hypothetical protein
MPRGATPGQNIHTSEAVAPLPARGVHRGGRQDRVRLFHEVEEQPRTRAARDVFGHEHVRDVVRRRVLEVEELGVALHHEDVAVRDARIEPVAFRAQGVLELGDERT